MINKSSDTKMGLWNKIKSVLGVNQPAQSPSQPPPSVIYQDMVMQKPRPPPNLLLSTAKAALNYGVTAIGKGVTAIGNLLTSERESGPGTRSTADVHFEPWRKSRHFNYRSLQKLKKKIAQYTTPPNVEVDQARILMIGPTGAEKTSFVNTINSIFSGRITDVGRYGSADSSFSTMYRQYQISPKGNSETMKFCLCDTCGIEESESEGPSLEDIKYFLDGCVPDKYKFNRSLPINPNIRGLRKRPGLVDKVHCAVFFFDATMVDVMSDKIWNTFRRVKHAVHIREIPQVILLTKIDGLCKNVQDDVSKVFECRKVNKAVEKVSEMLGIPRGYIHPIKNYEDETDLNDKVSHLALTALDQILGFANDFMMNCSEDLRMPEDGGNKERTKNLLTLMEKIENYSPPTELGIPFARILLIGPVMAGKSSFVHSIDSIFRGLILQPCVSGSHQRILKTEYKIKGRKTDYYLNFRFCDTCGIEDIQGPDLAELMFLIEGNVPDGYQFNLSAPITQDIPDFIKHPGLKNMVHCVVFVFDASAVGIIAERTWKKLKELQMRMINKGLPRAVLLTKIDRFSMPLGDDVSKVFHSEEVQNAVDLVSQRLGIEQNKIYPVINCVTETYLNEKTSNLLLLALDHILDFANDFLSRQENTMSNR